MASPEVDVLVLGAGVAGLVAARLLHDQGRTVRILEARARVGGRIDTDAAGIERGAEFIHGRGRNVRTWHYLERCGLTAKPRPLRGLRYVDGDRLRSPWWLLTRPGAWAFIRATMALARARRAPDLSVGELLRRRGLTSGVAARLGALAANDVCAPLDHWSAHEASGAIASGQLSGGDFCVVEGYGALPARLARGLDLRLGSAVEAVIAHADHVEVVAGVRHVARAAVVTFPLGVLKAGAIRFEPALPAGKARAIATLAMYPAAKLVFRFARAVGPPGAEVVAGDDVVPAFWRAPADPATWLGFVTGPAAAGLDRERAAARLCCLLGSGPADLTAVELVDWSADPHARGGYSTAPPGGCDARAALAAPVGPLCFAGEATTADGAPGTVSGAIGSGERAAAEIARQLDRA